MGDDADVTTADVVVIGGGQAGLSAGFYLRRAGLDSATLMLATTRKTDPAMTVQPPRAATIPLGVTKLTAILPRLGRPVASVARRSSQVDGRAPDPCADRRDRAAHDRSRARRASVPPQISHGCSGRPSLHNSDGWT